MKSNLLLIMFLHLTKLRNGEKFDVVDVTLIAIN